MVSLNCMKPDPDNRCVNITVCLNKESIPEPDRFKGERHLTMQDAIAHAGPSEDNTATHVTVYH
jgi:hypothetical protein